MFLLMLDKASVFLRISMSSNLVLNFPIILIMG